MATRSNNTGHWYADEACIRNTLTDHQPPVGVAGTDAFVQAFCSCGKVVASGPITELTGSAAAQAAVYQAWVQHVIDEMRPG